MTRYVLGTAMVMVLAGCNGAAEPDLTQPFNAPVYDRSVKAPIKLVQMSIPKEADLVDSRVISTAGGTLRVDGHELFVPRRAVEHPTRFTMTVKNGSNVIVELTAIDQVTGLAVTRFPLKLQLKLSYASVPITTSEANHLLVVWLRDDRADGALIPERSTLQPNQRYVIGWIDHFTQYAMGLE